MAQPQPRKSSDQKIVRSRWMITLPSVHLPFINVALPSRMRNEHGPSECARTRTLLSIFDLLGCFKTPLPFFVSACSDSFHDAHEVWWHLPLLVLGLVALGVGGRLAFSWNSSRKARKIERTLEEVYAQLWDAWYSKRIMCQAPLTAKRKPPLG